MPACLTIEAQRPASACDKLPTPLSPRPVSHHCANVRSAKLLETVSHRTLPIVRANRIHSHKTTTRCNKSPVYSSSRRHSLCTVTTRSSRSLNCPRSRSHRPFYEPAKTQPKPKIHGFDTRFAIRRITRRRSRSSGGTIEATSLSRLRQGLPRTANRLLHRLTQ